MKLIKMIFDSIPRIFIALLVVYLFFAVGPVFAIIGALMPVASRIIRKPRRLTTREFINEIDESGEYHE